MTCAQCGYTIGYDCFCHGCPGGCGARSPERCVCGERDEGEEILSQQSIESDVEAARIEPPQAVSNPEADRLRAAIKSCIAYANGHEGDWGDRAVEAFSFLYRALDP